ncbi:MAG TPA: hypothetical protein VEM40_11290 [Nitrospirota bacterium]|nr:hypothetical protein [Nitrospirota bacterium]
MVAVVIRPVIDCFYEFKYGIADIRPPEIFGVLLPTLLCLKILVSSEHGFRRAPLSGLWIFYLYFQLFSVVLITTVGNDAKMAIDYFFRAFNGFIGFFLYQEFFRTRKDFRVLLLAHIAAGLVPLGMSVYQNILGGVIRSETTIAGLVRNIGFYHDAYTLRFYCFQTMTAVILYWSYFMSGIRFLSRVFLLVITALSVFTVYRIYSKAGYLIAAEWLVIWFAARRQFLQLGVIVLLIIAALFLMKKDFSTIDMVYSKEIGAMQGKEKTEMMLQGRVGGWQSLLNEYAKAPLVLQLVGDGSSHTGAHNDFIRALLGTGMLGLILYLSLLITIGMRVIANCLRANTPLNVMALMLVGMWIVDAIGLVPGAYPSYQILVWGFVGLALRGVEGLDPKVNGESPERAEAGEMPVMA